MSKKRVKLELEIKRLLRQVSQQEDTIDRLLDDTITVKEKDAIKFGRYFDKSVPADFDKILAGVFNKEGFLDYHKVIPTDFVYEGKKIPDIINVGTLASKKAKENIDRLVKNTNLYDGKVPSPDKEPLYMQSIGKGIRVGDNIPDEMVTIQAPVGSFIVPPTDNATINNHLAVIKEELQKDNECTISLKDVNVWGHNVGDVTFQKSELLDSQKDIQGIGESQQTRRISNLMEQNDNLRMEIERLNKVIIMSQKREEKDLCNKSITNFMEQEFSNKLLEETYDIIRKAKERNPSTTPGVDCAGSRIPDTVDKCKNYKPRPDYLTIKESPIHKLGVFATKDIDRNTGTIGVTHVVIKDINIINNKEVDSELLRVDSGGYYNHSFAPNCKLILTDSRQNMIHSGMKQIIEYYSISPIRDIKEGEELTLNYNNEICGLDGYDGADFLKEEIDMPIEGRVYANSVGAKYYYNSDLGRYDKSNLPDLGGYSFYTPEDADKFLKRVK